MLYLGSNRNQKYQCGLVSQPRVRGWWNSALAFPFHLFYAFHIQDGGQGVSPSPVVLYPPNFQHE